MSDTYLRGPMGAVEFHRVGINISNKFRYLNNISYAKL